MALAVGAECRVAGVDVNDIAVIAVFALALKDAVILAVALVDVPAALRGDDLCCRACSVACATHEISYYCRRKEK